MRNSLVTKNPLRALGLAGALLMAPLMGAALHGCTDLDENPTGNVSPTNYYRTETEVIGGLAGVYAQLRQTLDNYYNISEVSTDEVVVPTRGQDWYDNGQWLELHRQTWTANSAAGLSLINGAYNDLSVGIARANTVLNALKPNSVPNQARYEAEVKVLRAFYYYLLMDAFGGVPIVTDVEIKPRERATRAEVFQFVESELLAARPAIPVNFANQADRDANWGRLTRGAIDALLANLYLNARVFTGTVSTSGLQPGQARWQDAINRADSVLNSGVYSLNTNWKSNFVFNNQNSPENIFVVRHSNVPDLGLNFLMRTTHYNQLNGESPWNGFATLADTYNSFEANDLRKTIFLVGPQVNLDTGQPIKDRAGNPLVYTPTINDITSATEGEGARLYKFTIDPNHKDRNMSNDYTYFRLAEMYLIKAEALNELGQTSTAVGLLNTLRARVGASSLATGGFTQATFRQQILKDRLYELTVEAKRRQDMIRLGAYTAAHQFKPQTEAYRILFPIPQTQLQTNPLLTQNPGY